MLEFIKKGLLAGLGAAVVTKEKIQEATRLLVKEGKISTEEAEKLAEELVTGGRHQWDELQAKISEMVRKGLDSLDISSKKEFQEMRARVEQLEDRLAKLENTASINGTALPSSRE